MDRPAAERAFTQAWDARERSVVLVEASDVARANAYRGFASPDQRAAMRNAALHAADKLVGRLLTHVDPSKDAVLVVGPYHSSLRREVTLASLRAPGVDPGWLRTGTTRRTGFVQIVDVAPTILRLLGIDRPEEMEGRPYEISATSKSFADRAHTLARLNRAAVFRDNNIGKVTAIVLVVTLVLAGAALLVFRRRLLGASQILEVAALAIIGFLVATYVAGLLPWYRWSVGLYFGFLFAFAVLYGLVCHTFGRRHPADALLIGLGGMMGLHLLDALSGARLEFNTVFGYTPTIGIRLAGLGNPGSAQLCASALLFAALLAWRVPAPTGRRLAVVVLVVTVVVVGAPVFGQDFGGAISAAPAYLLLGLLLYDKKITAKAVALLALGARARRTRGRVHRPRASRRQPDPRRPVLREGRQRGDLGVHHRRRAKGVAHAGDVQQHRMGAARPRRPRRARLGRVAHRPAPRRSPPRYRRSGPRSSRSRCSPSSARSSTTPASRSWG